VEKTGPQCDKLTTVSVRYVNNLRVDLLHSSDFSTSPGPGAGLASSASPTPIL